jgi:hypothetical protein
VFLVAHADYWQLFMGDVASRFIRERRPAVFIYTTAGDAGRPAPYWRAREKGALASVRVAAEIAGDGGYGLTQYAGYSTAEWPENLDVAEVSDKAGLFLAYERTIASGDAEWSAYAKAPRLYSAWLWRTYVRPPDFPGHSR